MIHVLVALALFTGAAAAQSKVVRAARMLDVKTGRYLGKPVIIIEGERIKTIEIGGKGVDRGEIIDLGSMTVLPGLIDCHTHLLSEVDPKNGDESVNAILTFARMSTAHRALLGAKLSREVLEAGITTVRDLGDSGRNGDVALRDAIRAGWLIGPRMVVSTRGISPLGSTFFQGFPPGVREAADSEQNVFVSGTEEARRAVRTAFADGADCIKIYANRGKGIFSAEEMKVIVDEAHRMGKKVGAHTVGDLAAKTAVDAGVDSIEHGYFIAEATLKTMAAKGTFLVMTEPDMESDDVWKSLYGMTPDELERMRKRRYGRVEQALKAGVRVAFGSDAYTRNPTWTRGMAALSGLMSYRKGGMPAIEVIRTATTNAAELLGLQKQTGSIEAGQFADIIGVAGDPIADISELRKVKFVMKAGQVIRKP